MNSEDDTFKPLRRYRARVYVELLAPDRYAAAYEIRLALQPAFERMNIGDLTEVGEE